MGACSAARDLIALNCTLPPHHAFAPHEVARVRVRVRVRSPNPKPNPTPNPYPNPNPNQVRVAVSGLGAAPPLAAAMVRYNVRLDSVSPSSGSLGGGTTLTLAGEI